MKINYKYFSLFLSCIFLTIGGCSILPFFEEKKTESIKLILMSAPLINPNLQYEPSPVEVNIYELKDIIDFNEASYDEIMKGDVFKDKLVKRTQLYLYPNKVIQKNIKINAKTKYLAATASFLNIENSTWKLPLIRQKEPVWINTQNYLHIYVDDLNMIQLGKKDMQKKLLEYAANNPNQKDVDKKGRIIKSKVDYSKGIYKQINQELK